MKPLIVHPGAHWSTHDCYVALTEALREAGRPFAEFRLDGRIGRAHDFLAYVRTQMSSEQQREVPPATVDEIRWQASTGVVERAILAGCDALLVVTGNLIRPELLHVARTVGLKVYVWFTESPYAAFETDMARCIDGCWTNERTSVTEFQAACPRVSYLPHGWRMGLHDQRAEYDTQVAAHDVVFVGSYFTERLALLESVNWAGIDLGLYGMTDMIPESSPLRPFVRAQLTSNEVTAALYRRAKVGLNLYRVPMAGKPAPESLNPRAYELAALGVCAVSETRAEVIERFGDAVPTFVSGEELEMSMRGLLESAGRRRSHGRASAETVRQDHWRTRSEQMWADAERWAA